MLSNPPQDNDYSEDILNSIKKGYNTKSKIIDEIGFDEYTYDRFIQSLRVKGIIQYASFSLTPFRLRIDSLQSMTMLYES